MANLSGQDIGDDIRMVILGKNNRQFQEQHINPHGSFLTLPNQRAVTYHTRLNISSHSVILSGNQHLKRAISIAKWIIDIDCLTN